MSTKIPFASILIKEVCDELGFSVWIEEEYGYVGYITFPNGKKHLFRNTNFNVNPLGSVEICRDKGYTAMFLERFGYKTTEGEVFFSDKRNTRLEKKKTLQDGLIYAQRLGFPIIVKPNDLSQGVGVHKINSPEEYNNAVRLVLEKSSVIRVERFYTGKDYRIVVFDDEIISSYERIALGVRGDGQHTIGELLAMKQESFISDGRDTVIDISDPRIENNLKKNSSSLQTLLKEGEYIQLLDNANLSTGGESIDTTQTMHNDYRDLALRVTRDMGLKLCGVDIITPDITKSLEEQGNQYVILELNGAPGLDNYMSAGEGQRNYVKSLYRKIVLTLSGMTN